MQECLCLYLLGTTSDLAPGLDANDGMQLLEQKATQAAAKAQEVPTKKLLFVRSEELQNNVEEVKNPAEINLEDSDEDDENEMVIQKQEIPDEVFGGIKKSEDE